jgi:hypothetical protein
MGMRFGLDFWEALIGTGTEELYATSGEGFVLPGSSTSV